MKRTVNYKYGALKRKYETGKDNQEPGTFISKVNEMKQEVKSKQSTPKTKLAIMGLV